MTQCAKIIVGFMANVGNVFYPTLTNVFFSSQRLLHLRYSHLPASAARLLVLVMGRRLGFGFRFELDTGNVVVVVDGFNGRLPSTRLTGRLAETAHVTHTSERDVIHSSPPSRDVPINRYLLQPYDRPQILHFRAYQLIRSQGNLITVHAWHRYAYQLHAAAASLSQTVTRTLP